MEYSKLVAYVLWLTLGWFGAHHFYIRRDRHAFVWLWTLGGGFGIGWMIEVFRLSSYVDSANKETHYASLERENIISRQMKYPPRSVKRIIGEFVFALWLGSLAMCTVPDDIGEAFIWISAAVGPLGAAIGFHTVANIGEEQCDFIVCLVISYVMCPFLLMSSKNTLLSTMMKGVLMMLSLLNYNWGPSEADSENKRSRLLTFRKIWTKRCRRYRQSKSVRVSLFTRATLFALSSVALGGCLCFAICYNAELTTQYGEKIKLRVAIQNFFSSPEWTAFRETDWKIFIQALENGSAENFFQHLATTFDIGGEHRAYQEQLGLDPVTPGALIYNFRAGLRGDRIRVILNPSQSSAKSTSLTVWFQSASILISKRQCFGFYDVTFQENKLSYNAQGSSIFNFLLKFLLLS